MKILKIFGVVVGVHVFALILIFANPGCSSSTRPAPRPADTVAASETPAAVTPPVVPPSVPVAEPAPAPALAPAPSLAAAPAESSATAPISFNPDLPAVAAPAVSRTSPTRPNTPVANALVAEPVSDVTPAKTYTVMSGDNLWNLSKKHGVPVSQLAAANNLKASAVLHPGQKLVIPGKAPASAAPAAATAPAAKAAPAAKPAASTRTSEAAPRSSGGTRHVVKPGESLSVIAKQYGVGTGDLAVANNITDPRKVRSGMELVIPAAGSRGAKAPAKAPEAPKPAESVPVPTLNLSAPASDVPVIRVDENVLTPAPKP